MFPILSLDSISITEANQCLTDWGHKMGVMNRPIGMAQAHAIVYEDRPVSIVVTADLIRESVGGAPFLNRENCIELARVCSEDADWNRVAVRLWRKVIFPAFGKPYAISYQDAILHRGNLYRFDGWTKIGFSRSGTDSRSGRKGRSKYVWAWAIPDHQHQLKAVAI